MSDKPNYTQILIAFALFAIVSGLAIGLAHRGDLLRLAPISTYQGIHPSFEAIGYNGRLYTTQNKYDASVSYIGPATMNWDPDKADAEMPNVRGELRDIRIVDDIGGFEVEETLAHIVSDFGGSYEPNRAYKTYKWQVDTDGDGWKETNYQMELWICSMEVNVFIDPDRGGLFTWSREIQNKLYPDLDVWLKIEASQDWGTYFDDPIIENTYFGLAYLELAELTKPEDHTRLTVVPGSQWSAFDLYNGLGGDVPIDPDEPDQQAYVYQGVELNPNVFKSEWYTKLNFGDFGTYDYNILGGSFKSDEVQVKALAHVFVVGEWIVQPPVDEPGDDDDLEDPDAPDQDPPWIDNPISQWIKSMSEKFSTPFGRVQLAIWLSIFLVALAIFINPSLIITIAKNWGNALADVEEIFKERKKED